MGRQWEDRLHVRLIDVVGIVIGLILGSMIPPAVLHGDPSRLLGTFLGLVSASILPSISLILASMTTSGRSVAAIDKLGAELMAAMNALLELLVMVGVVFAAVLTLSIDPPAWLAKLPWITDQGLPRLGQAIVVAGSIAIVLRARLVPAILRRCLTVRHEIAADEARKKTIENASKAGEAAAYFARDPAFGATVPLAEIIERDPH